MPRIGRLFLILLFFGVVAAVALFLFKDSFFPPKQTTLLSGTNHYIGSPKSDVTIEEFVDYQCVACADYDEINKKILAKYGTNIAFFVRHFPIKTHDNAFVAAQAAEAAGEQGKFFEMHELLLQNQDQWAQSNDPTPFFVKYATLLQLNTDQFKKTIENEIYKDNIDQDYRYGESFNLDAIPSVIINGKNEGYIKDEVAFSEKIDSALAKKTDPVPLPQATGIPQPTSGQKDGGLLSPKGYLWLLWFQLTSGSTKKEPSCVNVCKSGDCLCDIADVAITLHGEKPGEREEINDAISQLRNLKYAPARGGLSFIGRKLLDQAIDDIEELARKAEKIGRKLTGVDVYVTLVSLPCKNEQCASTTKWVWGKEQTKTYLINPPKDCRNKYVPDAWDEKCLLKNSDDFYPYISRESKKFCADSCQLK